jgi:WD40 repeat protein
MRAAVAGDLLVEDTAKRLTVWEISTGRKVRELDQSEHAYGDQFRLTDDGKRLVALNPARQELNVWDVTTGKLVHSKLPGADRVIHQLIGLSADGREAYAILTGIKAGDTYSDLPIEGIHAIRLEDGHVELRVRHPIKFNGYIVPPITADRRVFLDDRAWDLTTGKETGQYPWDHLDAVSPDGRLALAFHANPEVGWQIAVWDVAARLRLGLLPQLAFAPGPASAAFSPDGRLLALGGWRVWDGQSRPDAARSAAHFDNRALVLYDAQTQKRVRTLAFPVWPPDSQEIPPVDFPQGPGKR